MLTHAFIQRTLASLTFATGLAASCPRQVTPETAPTSETGSANGHDKFEQVKPLQSSARKLAIGLLAGGTFGLGLFSICRAFLITGVALF